MASDHDENCGKQLRAKAELDTHDGGYRVLGWLHFGNSKAKQTIELALGGWRREGEKSGLKICLHSVLRTYDLNPFSTTPASNSGVTGGTKP